MALQRWPRPGRYLPSRSSPRIIIRGLPSHEIRPPSESRRAALPPLRHGATPSLRVSVPCGAISMGSLLTYGVLPAPLRSAFRFSQPPDGLLLPMPRSLVSCHWHPLGSPFRALFLARSRAASRRPLPSCRSPSHTSKYRDVVAESSSGLCSPGKSGANRALVRLTAARSSPGIVPL